MLILQAPPEPSYAAAERASKMRDYEVLSQIISQWNANRLDLFALTLPNEVRFHYITGRGTSYYIHLERKLLITKK